MKKRMNKLHTATVGNPAMRMPGGARMPSLPGMLPGVEAYASNIMKKQMDELDVPPLYEFLDMIAAGGGEVYACKLAMDMFKPGKDDLCEHVSDILTVGDFYNKAAGLHAQIIFT